MQADIDNLRSLRANGFTAAPRELAPTERASEQCRGDGLVRPLMA